MPPRNQEALPAAGSAEQIDDELREIADQIKERRQQLNNKIRSCWYEDGCDLIKAKARAGHKKFDLWCKAELDHSKSKAEKLMRAAKLFAPHVKSGTVPVLPPPTVAYALSSGALPQHVQENFIARIVAGEEVAREVRAAVRASREQAKVAKLEDRHLQQAHEVADAEGSDAESPPSKVEPECATAASAEALDFIMDRVGSELPALLALLDEAGTGAVFTPAAERVLRERAAIASPSADSSVNPMADVGEDIQLAAVENTDPKRLARQSPANMTPAQQVALIKLFSTRSPTTQDVRKRRAS